VEKTRLEIGEDLLGDRAAMGMTGGDGGVKQRGYWITVHGWPLTGSEPAEAVDGIMHRAPMRLSGTREGGEEDGPVWTGQRAGPGQGGCDKGTELVMSQRGGVPERLTSHNSELCDVSR